MAKICSISKLIFVATLTASLFSHMSMSFGDLSIVGYSQDDLTSTSKLIELFNSWMLKHDKVYNGRDEKIYRFEIFKDNLKYIDETNKKNDDFWLGLTKFADLSNDEFKEKYVGSIAEISEIEESYDEEFNNHEHVVDLPENFDWRKKGAVNPIKNQGACGSCWAFSTIATVEGLNKIKKGKLVSLSEQQLVDCDKKSFGCKGGYQTTAYQYMQGNPVHLGKDYPYVAKQGPCRSVKGPTVSISGYKRVKSNSDQALIEAIVKNPVSVLVEAGGKDFQHYKGGIFKGSCGTKLDHAVTAVGYGKSKSGNFLIIRNSWGTGWGEKGYMYLQRLSGNTPGKCGVYKSSYYPV